MPAPRTILIILLAFFSWRCYGQDRIVTKEGEHIECRILSVDSNRIVYRLMHQSPRHEIARSQVENYYLSRVTANELEYLNRPEVEFFSLKFSGALAYPVGEFASMDASSELSGLANRGYQFCGEFIFKINTCIGVSALYLSQRHGFNYQAVTDFYNQQYGGNFFRASGEDWQMMGGFAGINLNFPFPVNKDLSFFINCYFGAPRFTLPEQVIDISPFSGLPSGGRIVLEHKETNSGSFLGGFGLRYKFSEYLAFHASTSIFTAHPSFYNIQVSYSSGFTEYINYQQSIQSLNLQAGISFIFYKK
ncbi:MAG TPA: hypothetical protein PLQ93_10305, partial [Bacteroidia bacterium]|nr:hypothetical protein [Bacteroidia bacterium]